MHYAALNGHLEVVRLLVDAGGAEAEMKNAAGRTALDEAENAGHVEVGEWLAGKMKAGDGYRGAEEINGEGGEEEGGMEAVNGGKAEDEMAPEGGGGVGEEEVRSGVDSLRLDEKEK